MKNKGWRAADPQKQDATTGLNQAIAQPGADAPTTPSTAATLQPGVDATAASNNPRMLGIAPVGVTPLLSNSLKMDEVQGIMVFAVYADSVASRAGIKKNDVILKHGDKVVNTNPELQSAIASTPAGTTVPITIWRGGNKIIVSAQY